MNVTFEQHTLNGTPFKVWRLENESGAWVKLSELGAGIIEVGVPDAAGKIENVALSYANPADYLDDGPCMGKIPGRYANRIAKGHLKINDELFRLAINNGPNALHGGPTGFQNRIWKSEKINDNTIQFKYISAAGEENYPGQLTATATYSWDNSDTLSLRLKATTDQPTVVNLTNHAYWNLDGADAGNILEHALQLNASNWLPTDDTLIPTGEIATVFNTPMDFTTGKTLGEDINADFPALIYGKGYDNCWVIDSPNEKFNTSLHKAAVLSSKNSGRQLTVYTDQPGVQVYTGNWLAGSPKNNSGKSYNDYDGVAIEAQGLPDAPNKPEFPSQLLMPGETYLRNIRLQFSTFGVVNYSTYKDL